MKTTTQALSEVQAASQTVAAIIAESAHVADFLNFYEKYIRAKIDAVAGLLNAGKPASVACAFWCRVSGIDPAKLAGIIEMKQAAYGNAILEPLGLFSNLSPFERIKLSLDNKASRLIRGGNYEGDDDILDFAGYLFLLSMCD